MAATRKLQGEIDRCLKKVTEGVETFEDIWQKVHNATNSNQKEKYEADLKKEIKKLQRLRDQIKSWIASAEIKDKSALLENRRLIETQMERFKVVERETKTKAYSKEGLGAAQKLDPAQRVKDEIRTWITQSINLLQIQIDQYESEVESLLAGKKKRLDRDKQERMDELRGKLDRHKFHITKLETILRLLDNDGVEVDQIRRIKDDVEYYIESSQDPDFEENEYIYDDIIGLDDVELSGTGISLGIPSSATTDSNNSNETGGSPSSLASGTSPVQSPATLNCSNANNLNYSSDSTSVEFTAADKRNKNENIASSKPVKPTAIRANNKADANSNSSSTNSSGSTTQNKIISSTPSKNQSHTANSSNSTTSVINNQQATANSISSNATGTNVQAQSVIQSTPPIAFAAVAKNNTSHLESDHHQQNSSFTLAASAVGSQLPSVNSLQQNSSVSSSQQSNSVHPSSNGATNAIPVSASIMHVHPNVSVVPSPGITTASSITDSSSSSSLSTSNSNSNNVIVNSNSNNVTNSTSGTSNTNALVNCVSPSSNSVANSSRTSPIPISPKQINGPANLKCVPTIGGSNSASEAMSTLKTIAQEAINRASVDTNLLTSSGNAEATRQQQLQQQQSAVVAAAAQHFSSAVTDATSGNAATNGPTSVSGPVVQSAGSGGKAPTNEAHIPPLLGVAPLGPSPLHKEHQFQFQMMEAAYYHLPQPCDSEKLTTYLHRQPVQTPLHYPQTQLPHSDTVEFFQRLSTETLFFVFYYMEGTKAQYLAAKALKKQSWRFHTKYMMWFQRHEEPKIINDDYEQGTYIYFDYEKWGQRKKEGFTFEYKYLEDKDLN
ncbi:CCR4-NOT transcription complex subunit 3 isoform X2 [Hermetia illucens]|uniref:CCR4-NOT transcription complex subunit 3 isoform X2 n=1 Tax=Hermetia illucens TaxID=343691 RepID=UPI0018CC1C70|nr:CCR4-NOT transcription complex subunit 3 isoform X2 [Hermetia illucens]